MVEEPSCVLCEFILLKNGEGNIVYICTLYCYILCCSFTFLLQKVVKMCARFCLWGKKLLIATRR